MDAKDIKEEFIGAFPPGVDQFIDWSDDPGKFAEAVAGVLKLHGADVVDRLRQELSPLTATELGIAAWERACALDQSFTTLTKGLETRRAQVIARLREYGPTTYELIRAVAQPLLLYLDPSQIQIVETNRDALRAAHTRSWYGSVTATDPIFVRWQVLDDPVCSLAGAQIDLAITGDLQKLQVQLTAPDGTTYFIWDYTTIGVGSVTGGAKWTLAASGTVVNLHGVWGSAANDVWAVGNAGTILNWDGTSWAAVASGTMEDLHAVWGSSATDAWAVGTNGILLNWDGIAWAAVVGPIGNDLFGVWGTSTTDVWAVGEGGATLHWDGAMWSVVASGTLEDLHGVWGSQTLDVWAVGTAGTILHWDGVTWATYASPTTKTLYSVWGAADTDVWIVGQDGTILTWQGIAWVSAISPTIKTLRSVWGSSANDIWAVGDTGTLIRKTGPHWEAGITSPTTAQLSGVWGSSAADIWAVGNGGVITRWGGLTEARTVRLYAPFFAGVAIRGTWTATVVSSDVAGITLSQAHLFIEALGRNPVGEGLGAAVFYWAVVADLTKVGTGYNLDALIPALRRINYATRQAELIRKSGGMMTLAAIPDEPQTIPCECLPG